MDMIKEKEGFMSVSKPKIKTNVARGKAARSSSHHDAR